MTWTAAAGIARISDVFGIRSRWRSPYAVSHAGGIAQRGTRPGADTVYARIFQRRVAELNLADRKAVMNARDYLHQDGQVIERVLAAGGTPAAAAVMAAAWERLPGTVQDAVRNPLGRVGAGPVRWGSVPAVQTDAVTCGAAVSAIINAIADPRVALWIQSGRVLAGNPPASVRWALATAQPHTIEERWRALQHGIHRRAAIAGVPWPRALGTSPWGLSRTLNVARVAWRRAWVDARDPEDVAAVAAHLRAALRDGIPVAAYVSGGVSQGMTAVVPRHVVGFVAATADGFLVYEPGAGELVDVAADSLGGIGSPVAAWGHWSALNLLVLPALRSRAGGPKRLA